MMQDFREENEKLKSELRSMVATSTSSAEESGEDKYKKKFQVLLKINRAWEDKHSRLKMRYQTLDVEKSQLEGERRGFSEYLYRLERRDACLQSEVKRLSDIAVIQDGIIGRYSAKINRSGYSYWNSTPSLACYSYCSGNISCNCRRNIRFFRFL